MPKNENFYLDSNSAQKKRPHFSVRDFPNFLLLIVEMRRYRVELGFADNDFIDGLKFDSDP